MIPEITADTKEKEIKKLINPCDCKQCESGCRFGSGIFAENEIKKAAEFMNLTEKQFKKKYLEETEEFNKKFLRPKIKRGEKPYGPCIFFDEKKKCEIHKTKPMQCRLSMSCKPYGEQLMLWFMLNYIIDKNDPECIRQYAAYLNSGGKTLKGGELKDIIPDKNKLKKILEFKILR